MSSAAFNASEVRCQSQSRRMIKPAASSHSGLPGAGPLAEIVSRAAVAEGYTAEAVDLLRNFIAGQPRDDSAAGRRMADFLREIVLKQGALRSLAVEKRRGTLAQEQLPPARPRSTPMSSS